jgi:hypothetical protein
MQSTSSRAYAQLSCHCTVADCGLLLQSARGGGVWNGFSWLRIGTDRRLVWIQWKTFGFWRHGVSLPFVLGDSQSVYSVWLHIWRPGFDPRQRQRIFLLVCVQTSSEVHPASYPMGTEGPFLGSKAQLRRGVDHWHSSSAEVKYE